MIALSGVVAAATALVVCPAPARADPEAEPEKPQETTIDDYQSWYVGVRVGLGPGIPVGGSDAQIRGATSLLINGELNFDIGRYVQLGLRGDVLLPGAEVPGADSSSLIDFLVQGRAFPVAFNALGITRPYLGVGFGYSSVSVKDCGVLGCGSDRPIHNGLLLNPLAGVRLDFPLERRLRGEMHPAARLVSVYIETGFQKSFWTEDPKPEVDRIVFIIGAGGSL